MNRLNPTLTTRHSPMGLALVVGLHAVFVYALIAGLGLNRSLTQESPPIRLIPQPDPLPSSEPPPATADPDLSSAFAVEVPIPDFRIEDPVAVADPVPTVPVSQGSGTAVAVPFLGPRVDPRHPLSRPPYPASSIRKEEEGTLTLAVLVGPDGRVNDAKVTLSSGFPALDEAAVIEAKRRWKLLPAMRGSAAVEDWTRLKVVFRLDQR